MTINIYYQSIQYNIVRMTWFNRLKSGLFKTAQNINQNISQILKSKKVDATMIEEIEELLIASDMGPAVSQKIAKTLSQKKFLTENNLEAEVKLFLQNIVAEELAPYSKSITLTNKPNVIVVCGVNVNGKTTTAGKLAMKFAKMGKKVMLAACDKFRAAATEQLIAWSKKANCEIITGKEKQEPASIAFQAVTLANQTDVDVLIIDTAGRLNNNKNLMLELEKIIRTIQKMNPEIMIDIIMVLDGGTGQNAMQQVEAFGKSINITGLIITKLDGTAKGGILLALTSKYKLPIYAIGVGEGIEDINDFNPQEFAKALFGN